MSELGPSRLFIGTTFLASGFIFGYGVANGVFYYKIRKEGGCAGVSQGKATNMLWISILIAIVAIVLFLWSIWRLVFTREAREKIKTKVKTKGKEYLYKPPEGLVSEETVDKVGAQTEDILRRLSPETASSSAPAEEAAITARVSAAQEF